MVNLWESCKVMWNFLQRSYLITYHVHPDKSFFMSDWTRLYWQSPYLCRDFLSKPNMMAGKRLICVSCQPFPSCSAVTILSHFFLRYLVKNSATLFNASDYEVAPPEYHRKAVWELSAPQHSERDASPPCQVTCKITIASLWSADLDELFSIELISLHRKSLRRSSQLRGKKDTVKRFYQIPFSLFILVICHFLFFSLFFFSFLKTPQLSR